MILGACLERQVWAVQQARRREVGVGPQAEEHLHDVLPLLVGQDVGPAPLQRDGQVRQLAEAALRHRAHLARLHGMDWCEPMLLCYEQDVVKKYIL